MFPDDETSLDDEDDGVFVLLTLGADEGTPLARSTQARPKQ